MSTKAGLVAIELRKLAYALDAQPDAVITKPYISFHGYSKDEFMAIARLLPRPLRKNVDEPEDPKWARVRVSHKNPALDVDASVPQSLTCQLIEPAKPAVYRCDPILSEEEEVEVTA
jgi:hypothetical protein